MRLCREQLVELRELAIQAAKGAGEVIESRVETEFSIDCKAAGDTRASQVVTEVDRLAQDVILERLGESLERFDLGLLSEEREEDASRFEKDYFWCVDPLDGTLPFIEGRSGYAVSIALVSRSGESVLGVVFDPRGEVIYDAARGAGVRRNGEDFSSSLQRGDNSVLTVFADRSLVCDERLTVLRGELERDGRGRGIERVRCVSQAGAALNACWALENGPACYFKFPKKSKGGGSLWDFAATSCLYGELGNVFGDIEGRPLELNRRGSTFLNHRGFCCATDSWIAECIWRSHTGNR